MYGIVWIVVGGRLTIMFAIIWCDGDFVVRGGDGDLLKM